MDNALLAMDNALLLESTSKDVLLVCRACAGGGDGVGVAAKAAQVAWSLAA
jgi:hypothetical protein